MSKKDKIRLFIIAAVIIASAVVVFPISDRVKLGLDLRGGAHIVLRATGTPENPVTGERINQLIAVLRNRIDQYGIVEPQIQAEGSDRVAVDLPGVEDPEAALELIGRTAVLQFRQVVNTGATPPPRVIRSNYDSEEDYNRAQTNWIGLMEEYELQVAALDERVKNDPSFLVARGQDDERVYVLGEVYVSGSQLAEAAATIDELGKPAVSIRFNKDGATAFEAATAANIGHQIAIVLDDVVISAPVVQTKIGAEGRITGNFTREEAIRLQVMLNAGALPLNVEVVENRSVGPTLGGDSIQSGVRAGLVGAVLIGIFMLVYYGLLGIAADIALATAMLTLMALIILMRTTLTLPGIGG
ncbi:MAG: protein translocase subunit SecD, partial [Synergistaceae bacterium]|nr:protein translocase subunit SecD [Synergistaceae bacterium]